MTALGATQEQEMFKPLAGVILLLAGMFPSVCSAEEFVLRWEHILCKEVDEKWVLQLAESGVISDVEKSKGTVTESIELHVKTGERFYNKVRFGKKTIEIRGDLKLRKADRTISRCTSAPRYRHPRDRLYRKRMGDWLSGLTKLRPTRRSA